jgi:hypothetical protein
MSEIKKLEREDGPFSLSLRSRDRLELWEYNTDNLTVKDKDGNDVLRIYNLSRENMADLHAELGRVLGTPPSVTQEHLRQLWLKLDQIFTRTPEEIR